MNTTQMETFVELARTLSYTETARILHLSQPAVSQQVSRLEVELGAKLLDRGSHGVALTEAGRTFYEDCRYILNCIGSARSRVRAQSDRHTSRLSVGMAGDAYIVRISTLMHRLHARLPDAGMRLVKDSPEALVGQLIRGDLDAALAAHTTRSLPSGLLFERLYDGRFVCVMPSDNPLASRRELGMSDIDGMQLICLEEGVAPKEMRDAQARILICTPNSPVTYTNTQSMGCALARAGIGVAIMPDFVCPDLPGIARVPVEGLDPLPYGILTRAADVGSPTIQALLIEARRLFAAGPLPQVSTARSSDGAA